MSRIGLLREAYDANWADLYVNGVLLVKDGDVAMDLVAQTFLYYFRKIESIKGDVNVKSFLLTTLRDLAVNHLRFNQSI
ncbi:MAG TPA: sigma factor [Hanamia sp.]|nr:sigma factor [Hanamia sp.]